jgi:hypothetical protein
MCKNKTNHRAKRAHIKTENNNDPEPENEDYETLARNGVHLKI